MFVNRPALGINPPIDFLDKVKNVLLSVSDIKWFNQTSELLYIELIFHVVVVECLGGTERTPSCANNGMWQLQQ